MPEKPITDKELLNRLREIDRLVEQDGTQALPLDPPDQQAQQQAQAPSLGRPGEPPPPPPVQVSFADENDGSFPDAGISVGAASVGIRELIDFLRNEMPRLIKESFTEDSG